MARGKKTPDAEAEELKVLDITNGEIVDEVVEDTDVDMDEALAEVPETHGEGIQGYMRDKIKNATQRQ